ncbi:MAG: carbon-nitrogen hydrolase [Opitutales bacterium]
MRLGLIQTTCQTGGDLTAVTERIAQAAEQGAQVICLQELFNLPYFCRVQDPALFDLAEPIPGPTTQALQAVAKDLGIVLVVPLFEKRAGGLYHNSAAILDADGTLLGVYRKQHIPQDPGFEEKFFFAPGDGGYRAWKTRFGTIGVLICWDQWYPEAARLTALAGAEVLLYPTAIGWLPSEKAALGAAQHNAWETVQRGHAVANGCFVAAVNRTGTEGPDDEPNARTQFWGQSFVANPYGEVIARAPVDDEVVLVVDCPLPAVEDFRRIWPFFRDRRIDTYGKISSRFDD